MLSFPRVPSSTPVFYFKLTAGIRERGSELGKVIVRERERDSFKSWGQECSSASQGHRYFMAFTFLHDKLMPRIDRVVLGMLGGAFNYHAFKLHPNISSLFLAHLHLALLRLCGKPQGHAVWRFFFTSQSWWKHGTEVQAFVPYKHFHTFVFYKVLFNLMLIYRGLFPLRSPQRRRQQRKSP